ncbi:hypothetical protein [Nostoc sp.]
MTVTCHLVKTSVAVILKEKIIMPVKEITKKNIPLNTNGTIELCTLVIISGVDISKPIVEAIAPTIRPPWNPFKIIAIKKIARIKNKIILEII